MRLEEILSAHNWRCLFATSAGEARTFSGWQECAVVMIDASQVEMAEVQMTIADTRYAQAIVYSAGRIEKLAISSIRERIFAWFTMVSVSDEQIMLSIERASDIASLIAEKNAPSLTQTYRRLFEASTLLQYADSLSRLLEQTCREIATAAGFGRAILVIGDSKFRIQAAQAYSTGDQDPIDLAELNGRPLMPVLPNTPLEQFGKGFAHEFSASRASDERHLVLPLERTDGTVIGFLTLDRCQSDDAGSAALTEPVALLLKLVAYFIETQAIRAELGRRKESGEVFTAARGQELRQAQDRFSRLVSLTEDIVYITDPDGRIVYLNESFAERLGYTRENYIGRMLGEVLLDLATDSEANQQLIAALADQNVQRRDGELELFTKSGYKTAFSLKHQWISQAGDVVAGQGLLRDMTEQQELRVQLIRSERLGIAGKLASGVAHEINNPLQAIASHLGGLRDRVEQDKGALDSLGIVSDSVERIRLIVRSLLDLQRTEQSARRSEDLNTVIEKALALLAPQLRQAHVDVKKSLAPELPNVKVNSAELEQVLLNLIINAISAMEGGGVLTIESRKDAERVSIRVGDTGKGIAPEVLSKLFQPFSTHREQGGGLGMGLYLSRNIMRSHGGDLIAESPPGSGAVFTAILPAKENK
jgi:PAS domain S-box-containing protein